MSLRSAAFASALACAAAAGAHAASGVVFNDENGNGVLDPSEDAVPSVEVSNGVDITRTDANGVYRLPERPGSQVFVIKPRGWRLPADGSNIPRTHVAAGQFPTFPLRKSPEPDSLRALVLTDPQPSSEAEVGYLSRGLVEGLGRKPVAAFGVTLGDIVYDRPDLFGAVNTALGRIGIPWYSLPGNHDLRLGTPDEAAAVAPFEAVYGPSTYAFHAGPALFVALDDVRPLGGPRYIGGLTDDQFQFLGNLLGGTPSSEWVVLMMHIPTFSPDPSGTEGFREKDRLRLFALLAGRRRVLILSGHTHYQRHVLHGAGDGWAGPEPLHEYNVAAACGGFWGGPPDKDGIPPGTMWDGTPPGYAVVGFSGDKASLEYFPARLPADHQIALHVPESVAPGQGYVSFYANVFNGHDGWTVEARVDDRAWNPIRRVLGWDPAYATAYLAQDAGSRPAAGKRLPDPAVCYHLWRGALPADLSPGRHVVHVRATDPSGRTFSAEQPLDVVAR
jgi:hypothetical protein